MVLQHGLLSHGGLESYRNYNDVAPSIKSQVKSVDLSQHVLKDKD
jgi:hypothetical protein